MKECGTTRTKHYQPKKFIQALLPRVFIEGESHKHGAPSQLILAITQFLTHPPPPLRHTQRAKPETYKIGIPHKSHCCHRLSGSPKAPVNKGILIRQNIPRTQSLSPSSQSGASSSSGRCMQGSKTSDLLSQRFTASRQYAGEKDAKLFSFWAAK